MKRLSLTAVFGCTICILTFACDRNAGARGDIMLSHEKQPGPVVKIRVDKELRLNGRLKFEFEISNPGIKPLYVFSSLLDPQNNSLIELSIDSKNKTVGVGFFRSVPAVGFPPYSFPSIQFREIAPGSTLTGTFVSAGPIVGFKDYSLVGTNLDEIRITSGSWEIRSGIAYGYEVESVTQAVRKSLRTGQEHPINAVVHWQRLEYSVPQTIEISK